MLTRKPVAPILLICAILFTRCASSKLDSVSKEYMKQASAKFDKADYAGEINICRLALIHDPKNDLAYALLGDAYSNMGKYDTAEREYDTASTMNPKRASYKFCRGYSLDKLDRYDEAITNYNFSIRNNYSRACAYNNRGLAEEKLKRYDDALNDFDSSYKAGYYYHRFVLLNKASIYITLDRFDLAMKAIDKCIAVDPWQLSRPAHEKNILVEQVISRKASLLKDTIFTNTARHFSDAYTFKGSYSVYGGHYKQALTYLNRPKALPLPDYNIPLTKGRIAFNTMNYVDAMSYFNKAIAIDTTNWDGYLWRGFLYCRLNQYKEAEADYKKAITIDSSESYGYLYMGRLNIVLNNTNSAIAYTTKAIEKDDAESISDAYNQRGYAYFLNKQYKEAIADYDVAVKKGTTWYQPYFDYNQEATAALEKKGDAFCALIHWQNPVTDVNYLKDSARFYVDNNESVNINFKITTNHPLVKDNVFVMMDGTSVANENTGTIKVLKEDAATQKYEYEYGTQLRFGHGKHIVSLDYDGKQSQRMQVVVE